MSEAPTPSIPKAALHGLTFYPVPHFDRVHAAFGASEDQFFNRHRLPAVPQQHVDAVGALFFKGGSLPEFDPRVDRTLAARATKAWLGSWAPAHEAKVATVAYAFWVWSTPGAIDAATSGEK